MLAAVLAVAAQAPVTWAQSAGDEQYADPFQQAPEKPAKKPARPNASRPQVGGQRVTGGVGGSGTSGRQTASPVARSTPPVAGTVGTGAAGSSGSAGSRGSAGAGHAAAPVNSHAQGKRELPRTGSPVLPIALSGIGALALGLSLLRGLRVRRQP